MAQMKKIFCALLSFHLFLIYSPLHFAQVVWQRYIAHDPSYERGAILWKVYANVLTTVDEALRTFMPTAEKFEEDIHVLSAAELAQVEEVTGITLDPTYHDHRFYFYIGKKAGKVIGYAGADTVPGKWGPIHYMVAFSPDGKVEDVLVVEYNEKRGKPVAKKRFLKQFFGKSTKDDIQLMKDIRGVTGASISSRGMTDGIRKMVHVFELIYLKKEARNP